MGAFVSLKEGSRLRPASNTPIDKDEIVWSYYRTALYSAGLDCGIGHTIIRHESLLGEVPVREKVLSPISAKCVVP
jgi:hypothetical protein